MIFLQARRAEEGGFAAETTPETTAEAAGLVEGNCGRGRPPEGESRSCLPALCLHLHFTSFSGARDYSQPQAGLEEPHGCPTCFSYSSFFLEIPIFSVLCKSASRCLWRYFWAQAKGSVRCFL